MEVYFHYFQGFFTMLVVVYNKVALYKLILHYCDTISIRLSEMG